MTNNPTSKKIQGPRTVVAEQFRRYAGRDVIPLKGRTKRPRDNGWTKQAYNGAKVIEKAITTNANIGLRLGPTDLVIDVDRRHGGELSFKRLCRDLGLDPTVFPRVNTGSGGLHAFATLPPGVKVMDTLKDYPGVEFKSAGRQVVAAGSIHPDTGKPYLWDDFCGTLADAPACPDSLLAAILRPVVDFKATGGGQHDPDQIADMLDKLEVTDYGTNDPWFELMCAVHHASGGDARQEWIDFSTSDPKFAADADAIGIRWDSLHTDKPGPITAATLYKALKSAGHADMIPKTSPQDDFDEFEDDSEDDSEVESGDAKKPHKFAAQKISTLLALPSPKWLVKSILIEGGLFEIYGRFKTGKTFWAVEIACCIATGHDFFDQAVKQGRVLYIIAEGSRKLFAYRIDAWCKARSKDNAAEYKRLSKLCEDNIDIVPRAVKIDIAEQVKAFVAINPGERALVVIDTLFRTMTGDTTNAKDFARYVSGCDLIRCVLKSAVLFLHHQKRNDASGGFGSVVGEASVDGAIKVSSPRTKETVLKLDFMRDADPGVKPWAAKINIHKIDDPELTDEDVTTVGVLEFTERGVSKAEDLLQIIKDHEPATAAALIAITNKPHATIERHLKQLRQKGLLKPKGLTLTAKGLESVVDIDADNDLEDDESSDD